MAHVSIDNTIFCHLVVWYTYSSVYQFQSRTCVQIDRGKLKVGRMWNNSSQRLTNRNVRHRTTRLVPVAKQTCPVIGQEFNLPTMWSSSDAGQLHWANDQQVQIHVLKSEKPLAEGLACVILLVFVLVHTWWIWAGKDFLHESDKCLEFSRVFKWWAKPWYRMMNNFPSFITHTCMCFISQMFDFINQQKMEPRHETTDVGVLSVPFQVSHVATRKISSQFRPKPPKTFKQIILHTC